jgi:hypothetical protein
MMVEHAKPGVSDNEQAVSTRVFGLRSDVHGIRV